jgi:signal peptidase I
VSADGGRIVSGSENGVLRVWSSGGGGEFEEIQHSDQSGKGIAISEDGQWTLIGKMCGEIELWDLRRCRLEYTFKNTFDGPFIDKYTPINTLAFSPNGARVVSSWRLVERYPQTNTWGDSYWTEENYIAIRVWDRERREQLCGIKDKCEKGVGAISSNGEKAIINSAGGTVRIWDLRQSEMLNSFFWKGHSTRVSAMATNEDGSRAVTTGTDGQVKIWDLELGGLVHSMPCNNWLLDAVGLASPRYPLLSWLVMSPDGRLAMGGSVSGLEFGLWDLAQRRLIRTLRDDQPFSFIPMVVDPHWRLAASGGEDGTLKIWDIEQGVVRCVLKGHSGKVCAVRAAHNERLIVSASLDQTIKVWDFERGHCLATFTGEGPINDCFLAPDGRTIVARESSGRFHFLRLMLPDVPANSFKESSISEEGSESSSQVRETPQIAPLVYAGTRSANVQFHEVNHWVRNLLANLLGFLILVEVLLVFLDQRTIVSGKGMMPQIYDQDHILVNKSAYNSKPIKRGDIVVFVYPPNPSEGAVKRIIGLPGDTVEISGGKVLINDRPIEEPYIAPECFDHHSFPPMHVEADHYFVLGDCRNLAKDSRAWGTVPRTYINGEVIEVYWPIQHFKLLK